MYTTGQKFGVNKILKEVSYAFQDCIYLIENNNNTVKH